MFSSALSLSAVFAMFVCTSQTTVERRFGLPGLPIIKNIVAPIKEGVESIPVVGGIVQTGEKIIQNSIGVIDPLINTAVEVDGIVTNTVNNATSAFEIPNVTNGGILSIPATIVTDLVGEFTDISKTPSLVLNLIDEVSNQLSAIFDPNSAFYTTILKMIIPIILFIYDNIFKPIYDLIEPIFNWLI